MMFVRFLPRLGFTALIALLLLSCDKKSPTGPSGNGPQVTSVSPGSGTTLGGTAVTIAGARFAAGATVTIGAAAATDVVVVNETTITATTPQHASGRADVVVSVNGKSGTLAGGYSFAAPSQSQNPAPIITTITAVGTRRREPKSFADLDETINVTAVVSDDETPPDQLDYQWSAPAGGFNGSGRTVTWTAPHTTGPVVLTVVVVEKYQSTDDRGLPVTKENQTTGTITVNVHDSRGEVSDMAYTFLLEFSRQSPSPQEILRNFSDACPGKSSELTDVVVNQRDGIITSYTLDQPQVTIAFGSTCTFVAHGARSADACAYVHAHWHTIDRTTHQDRPDVVGIDQVGAVFDGTRWWLCDSDWFEDGKDAIAPTATAGVTPGRVR
jgi:hypothetical protein